MLKERWVLILMKKRKDIPTFYEGMDREMEEAIREVQADRKAGRIKDPPRHLSDCKTLEDLCLYIFERVHLIGTHQMLKSDTGIIRWVWCGRDFNDRLVAVVEKVAPSLPDTNNLQELRLVGTHVTAEGVQRLRKTFKKAEITTYTEEDERANWRWSQASYIG